jgi:hypothetical protein
MKTRLLLIEIINIEETLLKIITNDPIQMHLLNKLSFMTFFSHLTPAQWS